MRIILNMATLRSHGSAGVGQGVLAGLARTAREHQFLAFVPAQWNLSQSIGYEHIRLQPVPGGWRGKLLTEIGLIPRAFSWFKADRLFSLTNTSVLKSPVPHLLLVHQAYLAYKPASLSFALSPGFSLKLRLMASLFRLAMPAAHHFTVQNFSMKRHLSARWGIEPERITVIPSAVEIDTNLAKMGISNSPQRPYICYVAGNSPHKNFDTVIEMLYILKQWGIILECHLTLHAGQSPALLCRAQHLKVDNQIIWRGPLPRNEVFDMMSQARALVMPSLLESFGLPYFEALALGCPIVASDLDFARDACADAALYASPHSPAAFADQVQRLVNDTVLREALQTRQHRRYKEIACSWDTVAGRYLDLLAAMPT